MAKLVLFMAVIVALVALSTAEGDNTVQPHCQRQLQESSLEACRQVVDHQLAVQLPFFHPRSSLLRSSEWRSEVRGQCCQQLRHVSPECRAAAIHQIVRHYEQQVVAPVGRGSYYPSETYPQQEQGQEQQQQEQGMYGPSQTYGQQEQGMYGPSQTYQQQQLEQGMYGPPHQTYRPQHQEQGSYHHSQTFPQQQQQEEGGVCGQSTAQQRGRHESFGSPHLHSIIDISRHGRQPAAQHELGETAQQQEGQGPYFGRQGQQTGFGESSSPHRYGTEHEQQAARLRQARLVAKVRQVAAQLPAMCQLQGRAFSAGQY
uniref:Uncharacterized protein n=1 Tax=Avena sativa TaxID=4498 RepID=A0ACD5T8X4_AVESA